MAAWIRRLGDTRRGTQNHILATTVTSMIAFDITALVVDRHDVRAHDSVWPQNENIVDLLKYPQQLKWLKSILS